MEVYLCYTLAGTQNNGPLWEDGVKTTFVERLEYEHINYVHYL